MVAHDCSIGGENMNTAKGPWIHRFMIYFFTVVLAVLVFWVLGFLVEDVESIQGPQYPEIEKRYVDQDLVARTKALMAEITDVDRAISNKREEMRIVSDSSQNLQNTINQLIELQKLAVQRSVSLSEKEQANLSESLALFLESQKRYQVHNNELSQLTDRKRSLESERTAIEKEIAAQRVPAREEYQALREKHDLRLAGYSSEGGFRHTQVFPCPIRQVCSRRRPPYSRDNTPGVFHQGHCLSESQPADKAVSRGL